MFDIGWSEMAVIAIVALVVLGPKELPNALKTASHWLRTARKMAREFQSGVDQIVRDAELDEARKTVQQARKINLGREIEKVVDPTGETKRQLNQQPEEAPAAGTPEKAAPLATGSAALAGPAAEPTSPPPPADHSDPDDTPAPEPAAAGDRHG